jgi:hypothetical protein
MSVIKNLSKVGVAAALAAGLAITLQSSASAAAVAPLDIAVTVTPSTDLEDGAVVQVTGTGLDPDTAYYVGECADVEPGTTVCNEEGRPSVSFTSDAGGTGSTPFTAHRTFDGFAVGGAHWGTVDCTVVSCVIGVGNDTGGAGSPPLSFK